MNKKQLLGVIGAIALVLNVILFSFLIISPLVFWMVIGVGAIIVFYLKRMNAASA
ncbi:hypothetical protein HYX14_06625 [Candidatus Woesearchaeota archaeon]|nr:hypothetical protein [Candidatus Woesearchaeota archaeon]